jgi:hypothetical protein
VEAASLALSVIALVVALASARYTRTQAVASERQAVEAERIRQIEAHRRHEEREPKVVCEAEPVNSVSGRYRLWVTLESAVPLTRIQAEIIEGKPVNFSRDQDDVPPGSVAPMQVDHHPAGGVLRPGEGVAWQIDYDGANGSVTIRVRLTLHAVSEAGEPEQWQLLRDVDLRGRDIW